MHLLSRALVLLLALSFGSGSPAALAQVSAHRALLVRTLPDYPELARRMHISGDVIVRAEVLPDGTVTESHATSGHALLRHSAEEAVRHWRFASSPEEDVTLVHVIFRDEDPDAAEK